MMTRVLFFILILCVSDSSFAEVFKWVDEKGGVHFTDDVMQIPQKYRPKTEKMEMPELGVDKKKEGESAPKGKGDTQVDRLGKGEEYWKGRMEGGRRKLNALQERVETLRIKYNDLTEKINDSKNSVERATIRKERELIKNEIEQCKAQIEEAKAMVDKRIPEEAELYKAKPEWIK